MKALTRKLVRDLWQIRGQALAIGLVIACGVATFVMSLSTLTSLKQTMAIYYDRYRFAQVFAQLKRAPDLVVARLKEIPGVAQVNTRIVEHVTVQVEGMAEPAVARLVSIPDRPTAGLNERYLRKGRQPEPGRSGEVLVSEAFASAHRLEPGDTVRAVINGRLQRLRIVGVALSPEYIYQIRQGDLLPDDRRFGVFWMGYTELAAAFNSRGAFNDVSATLSRGASEREVLRRIDRVLEPYGCLGAYGRDDQPSHKFINNELNELRGMAIVVPTIFLLVAAFLLHVVVTRLVQTQREQIAALKAFGYTRVEVGTHYLQMVMVIVVFGVILGTVVGARLGRGVTELYTRFFHFPVFTFTLEPGIVLLAGGVSLTVAVVGTLAAVYRAARLPPAEAMRPEAPAYYGPTLMEGLGLGRWLSPAARMILRHLERQPVRTLLAVLGIALAVAVLILGNFMVDAIEYAMEAQFTVAQRQDMTVGFAEATEPRVLSDLRQLPGVQTCEPMRGVAVRLHHEHRTRRLGITGIRPDSRLYRVVDIHRRVVAVPPAGLILSEKLAEVLGVGVGDSVMVEVLEGRRRVQQLPVVGLVADFAGIAAYMDLAAINRLMDEGPVVTAVFLGVDRAREAELFAQLKKTPQVASLTLRGASLETFRKTVAENLLRMRLFNVGFAVIIAFGVVYNSARINLAERSRELATLRVMGFYRSEISLILLGELAIVTLGAIPLGLVIGYGLAGLVIETAYDTELFRMPLIVSRWTYAFASSVTLVAALFSGLVVRRMLDRLDLVAVLKSKE